LLLKIFSDYVQGFCENIFKLFSNSCFVPLILLVSLKGYNMSVLIKIAPIKTMYNIRIKSEMYQKIHCTATDDVF